MINRQGFAWEQEVPLAQLEAYITERGNPGNEKGLVEARVELPLPFLRRGLHFIDTPGIGSARHENTATTYAFLPRMNAVIFVTSVEAPLSEAEEGFLIDIRGQVRQLFVVVNKIDVLGDTDRGEVLDYIHTRVEQLLGTGNVHISPLSARDGLTAKLKHDGASIQRSGLAAFEQMLTAFLAEEQGRTFLVSVLDHAQRILNETEPALSNASAEGEIETQKSALGLHRKMGSLRASLMADVPLSAVPTAAQPVAADLRVIDQVIDTSRSPAREPVVGKQRRACVPARSVRTGTGTFCVLCEVAIQARYGHHSTACIRCQARLVSHTYVAVSGDGFTARNQQWLCAAYRGDGSRAVSSH